MSDQPRPLSRDSYRIVTDRYSGFEVTDPALVAAVVATRGSQHTRNCGRRDSLRAEGREENERRCRRARSLTDRGADGGDRLRSTVLVQFELE
jgi:hypothetical protein